MNKFIVIMFLAVITTPGIVQLAGSASGASANEKRKLAAMPAFPTSLAALWKFPSAFAAYYGDHFGLRSRLIRLHAVLTYRLFGISPSEKVLVGRDGWLYYADDSSLEDFHSAKPLTWDELKRWKEVLEEREAWLAKRNAKQVIVFACDKHVIYPEFMPSGYKQQTLYPRAATLASYLEWQSKLTIVRCDLPLSLGKRTDRLYHRTDTHWNDRGAYLAYQEILSALAPMPPGSWRTGIRPAGGIAPREYEPVEQMTDGWDLARMMGLADMIHEEDRRLVPREPRRAKIVEIDRPDPTWNVGRVVLEVDDTTLPRLVMFRDSFGSALVPFLAEHFRRSVFLWQYDFDPAVIEKEKPDVVIWLMTSRRLQWFVPVNPPLPAS